MYSPPRYFWLPCSSLSFPWLVPGAKNFHLQTINAVKMAFFTSLIPLAHFTYSQTELTLNMKWMNLVTLNLPILFQFDEYTLIFIPIALFVSWNILEYSVWYMHEDPNVTLFFKYLLIFLLAMILLVSSGNLLLLFIGWEGVGIMSFLLIGWYHARSDAATAALQAILYNRIGDIGFLMAFCWLMKNAQSTELSYILSMNPPTVILIALITAAASKSAQFGLHPWLASAMGGPTPVSALLHSSTMVVAGIFLLIRIHPLLSQNSTALMVCLLLGAISTFFSATCALLQNDIKKIIAYSTSSQLGLMMVAIGLNLPYLAFFHICTHAFFKAMLFLCSGLIIHATNNEQDIRKLGDFKSLLPATSACLMVGSLALMGIPFLAGFYSKDAIIEAANTSSINLITLLLVIVATALTATYSMRLIYYTSMMNPRTHPILPLNEDSTLTLKPLIRLATGSIIAGLLMNLILTPNHPPTHTMPSYMKLTAFVITTLTFTVTYDLMKILSTSSSIFTPKNLNPLFYNQLLHRLIPNTILTSAEHPVTHLTESILLKKLGPAYIQQIQLHPIKITQLAQTGLIKYYLTTLMLTLIFTLIVLQLA
uniref:NADH-ubiquinone oxidoreductase chain 5 n=1 Tax=Amolops larutensis TaxID=325560 RepID=D7UPU5_9NEOB|nr:NADH dehydrogenase subunit 5 [Amolops larutensis]